MADILIRGMEMPNSCFDCDILSHCKHRDYAYSYNFSKRPPGCPLVPLPTEVKILPAADVRPVVRGEWKKAYADHEAFGVRPFYRYCSKCHEATVHQYNFCPNCGADMRKSQALHEASQYADADVMMPAT